MEFIATQKFLRLSPRKVRPLVALIKDMSPRDAIERLPFIKKRASLPLGKVILQALANAKQKGFSEGDLKFKEIQIGEGPRLKRGNPVSRGQWHPIKKRMSHIRVVLTTQLKTQKSNVKTEQAKEQEETKLKRGDKKGAPETSA